MTKDELRGITEMMEEVVIGVKLSKTVEYGVHQRKVMEMGKQVEEAINEVVKDLPMNKKLNKLFRAYREAEGGFGGFAAQYALYQGVFLGYALAAGEKVFEDIEELQRGSHV